MDIIYVVVKGEVVYRNDTVPTVPANRPSAGTAPRPAPHLNLLLPRTAAVTVTRPLPRPSARPPPLMQQPRSASLLARTHSYIISSLSLTHSLTHSHTPAHFLDHHSLSPALYCTHRHVVILIVFQRSRGEGAQDGGAEAGGPRGARQGSGAQQGDRRLRAPEESHRRGREL
jgi:hypothetical protein